MRVFDVPGRYIGCGRQLRVAVHGSCRVHDPFESLALSGEFVKVWAIDAFVSYTLSEACQVLQYVLEGKELPARLLPFIIGNADKLAPWEPAHKRILEGVDAFIVEVSELREIRFRQCFFQMQEFVRNFVTEYGPALTPWFAAFSTEKFISEELVSEALLSLPDVPTAEYEFVETILRETRLERIDVDAMVDGIKRINANLDTRCLFVSHFTVPKLTGTIMEDRRNLAEILRQATDSCGVEFFDPTELVAHHGREQVLADAGRDIYHYEPRFRAQVAESLLQRVQSSGSSTTRPAGNYFGAAPFVERQAVETVTTKLSASLISLHRERLGQLGVDGSGLHSHYASLLKRGEIPGKQETDLVDMILNYLPEFEEYHVLCAGLGEVAFLLAALGRATTACDPFTSRFSAITAGAAHLSATGLLARGRFRAIETVVPRVRRRNRMFCVATQLAITISAMEEERVLGELEDYRALLFRPGLLVRSRGSVAEQEELLGRFRAAGFSLMREYPLRNLVYCAKEGEIADAPPRLGGRLRALVRTLMGRSR